MTISNDHIFHMVAHIIYLLHDVHNLINTSRTSWISASWFDLMAAGHWVTDAPMHHLSQWLGASCESTPWTLNEPRQTCIDGTFRVVYWMGIRGYMTKAWFFRWVDGGFKLAILRANSNNTSSSSWRTGPGEDHASNTILLNHLANHYPLVMTNIAIENDHRNSGFSH